MNNSSTPRSGNSHATTAAWRPVSDIPEQLRSDDGRHASPQGATSPVDLAPGAAAPIATPTGADRAKFDPSSSREALIATAAYYRAEKRAFAPGHETEDWLAAEREVDAFGTDLAL
jgi:hypothetical protein